MAKKKSSLINMVFTLFVITLVASAALGYIYELTKDPISQMKQNKKLQAIKIVVPEFNNNPSADMYKIPTYEGTDSLECYPAKKDGELVGTAVKTYTKNGFGGLVWLMVGFKTDGTINDISVLEQNETPGLGTKMTTAKFKNQFNNKNPEQYKLSVKKDGGDVDAITAATISSRAFCDAVNRAHKSFKNKGGDK
ncbi:MAG: RnfABCDGE type electron transport complex subunit G [Bacteroidetes bacterium]|nr:MAG: RnfABCDGE type electron transport complex subunit G [Bacteroidota bacterium]